MTASVTRGAAGAVAAALAARCWPCRGGAADAPARSASGRRPSRRAGSSAAGAKAGAADYAQRFATLCAACHGANGRSDMPGTPVLAGQPSFYAITQLFLFREGRRSNEAMTAVAKTMTDDDLRGFSDYIGTLPPVPAPAAGRAARCGAHDARARRWRSSTSACSATAPIWPAASRCRASAASARTTCARRCRAFAPGKRAGYTQAMTEAVSQIPPADLDLLAYYASRVPVAGR